MWGSCDAMQFENLPAGVAPAQIEKSGSSQHSALSGWCCLDYCATS
jgi:hypothetical protein